MRKESWFKWVIVGATACVLLSGEAMARSQGAFLGTSARPNERSCFVESFGGVAQAYCNQNSRWVVPLVLDNNFGITVRVTAAGAGYGASRVVCEMWTVSQYGGAAIHASTDWTEFNDGRVERLDLPVSPHGFGNTYALCDMGRNSRLVNVSY